uniref:Uncharacterized protein n=1 Tax=Opuntia streptacantha TaxID=393608 RepID=A0A7C9E2K4_OPUST
MSPSTDLRSPNYNTHYIHQNDDVPLPEHHKQTNKHVEGETESKRESLRFGELFLPPLSSSQMLGDLSQGLQITPNNGIHKQACLLLSVTRGCVNNVRFHHDGPAVVLPAVE